MPEEQGRCVVCGSGPTIKAHLFPRSLARRIKGEEAHLVEGAKDRRGIRFSQSGQWNDTFLCERHERSFARADDYVARFCRRFDFAAAISDTGNSYSVSNPRPELLLRFTCATIWRHVASKEGTRHNLNLGPYKETLEGYLFDDQPLLLQALVGRSNIVDARGKRVEIGIPPYRRKLKDWTVWHFTIGGFDFFLKTDQRPFPGYWKEFLLNDNDPLTVPVIDPLRLDSIPMLQPIFSKMLEARLR